MRRRLESEERAYIALEGVLHASQFMLLPVYVIFLLSKSLSYLQVGIVDGIFLVAILVTNYPTGAFADRFGRRPAVVLGCLLWGSGLVIYGLSTDFLDFIVAEIVSGVGLAFYSGAAMAWLYDSLLRKGLEKRSSESFGIATSASTALGLLFPVLSGYLGGFNLELPFLIGGGLGLGAAVVAHVTMTGDTVPRKAHVRSIGTTMRSGWTGLVGSRTLTLVTVSIVIASAAYPFVNIYWQPKLAALGAPLIELGITGSLMIGAISATSYVAGKASTILGPVLPAMLGLLAMAVGALVGALAFSPLLLVACLVTWRGGYGLNRPPVQAWSNDLLPSETRATTLSLQSTLASSGSVAGMVISGIVADATGLGVVFAVSAVLFGVSIVPVLVSRLGTPREAHRPLGPSGAT